MLVPFQTHGTKPPFFLVHGLFGVTPEILAPDRFQDGDRPGYFLVARGFDGGATPCESVREMVGVYVKEIVRAHPSEPYLIGGTCDGCRVAIDIARELMASGRSVGPVLLLDPPVVPHQTPQAQARLELELQKPAMRQQMTDQASRTVRMLNDDLKAKLFDSSDTAQMEIATRVAAATALALLRHVLMPFYGEVEMIVSGHRAPRYFDPGHSWQKVLLGRRAVHVLNGNHLEMFTTHIPAVRRLIRVYLDTALDRAAGDAGGDRPSPAFDLDILPNTLIQDPR